MSGKFSLRKFSRFCWQVLAITLVLFALVVSLFRGLLPQLDEVRTELVKYVEQQYQVEVSVGSLSAEWQAFGPALTVSKLVIPPQDNLPFTLEVNNVHIKFNFWKSLFTASPQIGNVIFDGVHVALDLDNLNETNSATYAQDSDSDWLYRLLLEQLGRYSIKQASLQIISKKHNFHPIFIKDLKWSNSSNRHRGQGKLYLDEDASQVELLLLQIDISGSGHRPDELKGQVYLAAQSLDLGEWASRQTNPYDDKAKLELEGVVNLQAWFNLGNRSIESSLVEFSPSWLEWSLNDQPQRFGVQSGQLEWLPTITGWRLTSLDLAFESNQQAWPEFVFVAERRELDLFVYLNRLNTDSLLPLLPLMPGMELAGLKKWQQLNPQGAIESIKLTKREGQAPRLALSVDQLTWLQDGSIPGSAPIDFKFGWENESLFLSAPKQNYQLDFGGGFKQPISLTGEALEAKYDLTTQTILIPQLKLSNEDVAVDASIKLELKEKIHLALLSTLQVNDVTDVGNYLPLNGMSQGLIDYLEAGLIAGHIQDGRVVWNGNLSDYPYLDHSGVFQANFTLEEAEFSFQPDWPAVTDLSLMAQFENEAMLLTIERGHLLDVVIDDAEISIPQLGARSLLQVKADLTTSGKAATQVIQASPLADSVGSTLAVVQINGEISASLDLDIPLYEAQAGELVEKEMRGLITFNKTPIYITEPGVLLDQLTGQVSFLNEVVKGEEISALLYHQPISLAFDTDYVGSNYGLNLDVMGDWSLADLSEELNNPLQDFYSGDISWGGAMTLVIDPYGYRIQAQVKTDLIGAELDLPAPFAKEKDELRRLTVELIGDNKQLSLGIKLGKQMEFWGEFNQESGHRLAHYDLLLGRLFKLGDRLRKNQGHLQIDIEQTELGPWLPMINTFIADSKVSDVAKIIDEMGLTGVESGLDIQANIASVAPEQLSSPASFFPPLNSLQANIADFNVMGQTLVNLKMTAYPTPDSWRFQASSNEFDGRVDFYPDWATQGLKLVATKFHLAPHFKAQKDANFKTNTVLENLPPLALDVDEFSFYGRPLGHLVFQASPKGNSYQIQTLSLTTPEIKLRGEGIWLNDNHENVTQLDMTLTATKFDAISAIVDTDPGLKDAPVEVNAEISWQGAPYQFALESLNGRVMFELGKGHLSEVSDQGARIFSLFSLDSLLRKLSLDFTDVFGEGLYFNSFTGTLNIDNGVVKTHDTEMDAVAGNMKVRGYTNLMTGSLNYDIRFVPQLASSVPTVVFLTTGGWTLGLGAFALTKVLEPVIEVISEIRFQLTGTMAEPKLEEIGRKSKEIEIPKSALPREKEDPQSTGKPQQSDQSQFDSDSHLNQEPVKKEEIQLRKLDSGVEIPATNVIQMPSFKESERIGKEPEDADQPTSVPKQSRCIQKSGVYRVAA
ncbi:MAG: YhdP family protein [Shewanella sp.]